MATKTTAATTAAKAAADEATGKPATSAPEQKGKVTGPQVAAALTGAMDAGGATASAIAGKLAGIDFVATPEDEAARAIQAAIEAVTEADDKTGGAPAGQGARINHGQAIIAARALRAAVS